MKNIQKLILSSVLVFALLFVFLVSSFAQEHEKGKHHHNKKERLEKMKTELELSNAQVEQIKALHQKKKEESNTQRKENRAEFKAEMDKILTPEQRKKAEALKAERKNPESRAEKRVEKWKTELSLNDAQTAKVKTALITRMTKMKALKEAAGEERIDKTEVEKLKTAFETELKSILSDEQFANYQEIKTDRKAKRGENRKGRRE